MRIVGQLIKNIKRFAFPANVFVGAKAYIELVMAAKFKQFCASVFFNVMDFLMFTLIEMNIVMM